MRLAQPQSNAGSIIRRHTPRILRLLVGLIVWFSTIELCLPSAAADDSRGPLKLFTGRALVRAFQQAHHKNRKYSLAKYAVSSETNSPTLADNAKLGPMENVFLSSSKESALLADYRVLMRSDIPRATTDPNELYSEAELGSFAGGLLACQSAKTFVQVVQDSELEPLYRHALKQLRWLGDYATLQVFQGSSGELGLEHGSRTRASRLLQLKLQANTHDILEPRLRMGENLVLRYDPLRQGTMLEYQIDF